MKHLTQNNQKNAIKHVLTFLFCVYGTLYANTNKTQTDGKKHTKNGKIETAQKHGKK